MTGSRSDDPPDNSLGNESPSGVQQAGVIDLFGFDQKKNEVLLVMNEPRPWDGSDIRLHELQEKFNAYVSFLLDGEMTTRIRSLQGSRLASNCAVPKCPMKKRSRY